MVLQYHKYIVLAKISQKRYMMRPGITGLAQVHGGRNIRHKQKLAYDLAKESVEYNNLDNQINLTKKYIFFNK